MAVMAEVSVVKAMAAKGALSRKKTPHQLRRQVLAVGGGTAVAAKHDFTAVADGGNNGGGGAIDCRRQICQLHKIAGAFFAALLNGLHD